MAASNLAASPNVTLARETDIFPFTRVGNDWQGRNNQVVNALGEWVTIWVEGESHSDVGTNWRCNIAFSDDEGETWSANNQDLEGNAVTGFPLAPVQSPATAISDFQFMKCPNGDLVIIGQERGISTGTWNDTNVTQSQFRSTNHGKTWSFEFDFSAAIGYTTTAQKSYIMGNYENVVVGGTIYLCLNEVNPTGPKYRIGFYKSEDNAATWTKVSQITEYDERPYDWTEVSLVYLGGSKIGALASQNGSNFNTAEWRMSDDMGLTWGSVVDITGAIGWTGICQPRTFVTGANLLFTGRDQKRYFYDPMQTWNDRNSFWTTPLSDLFNPAKTHRYLLDPFYAGASKSSLELGDSGYVRLFVKADKTFLFLGYYGTHGAAKIYRYKVGHTTLPPIEHYANNNFFPETITPDGIRLQCNRDNISASTTLSPSVGIAVVSRVHNTLQTSDVWLTPNFTSTANELVIDNAGIGWLQLVNGNVATNNDLANLLFKASFSIGFWIQPDDGQPSAVNVIVWNNSDLNTTLSHGLQIQLEGTGKIRFRYSVGGVFVNALTNDVIFTNGAVSPRHIAATFTSGGLIRVYVDGELQTLDAGTSGDMSAVTMASFNSARAIIIGRRRTGADSFDFPFVGKIREFIIQPVVWSAGDIANIMLN